MATEIGDSRQGEELGPASLLPLDVSFVPLGLLGPVSFSSIAEPPKLRSGLPTPPVAPELGSVLGPGTVSLLGVCSVPGLIALPVSLSIVPPGALPVPVSLYGWIVVSLLLLGWLVSGAPTSLDGFSAEPVSEG